MPVPAGWKSSPCSRQNARISVYFSTFSGDRFWMSWSSTTTGCRGSWIRVAPMDRNLEMTADVLSWVRMWRGRSDTMSPGRSGRCGPSTM
jgi:hypothetical protein